MRNAVITPALMAGLLAGILAYMPLEAAATTTQGSGQKTPVMSAVEKNLVNSQEAPHMVEPDASYTGLWQGSLQLPGASLRLVMDIQPVKAGLDAKTATGAKVLYAITLFSPDQTEKGFPADTADIAGNTIRVTIKSLGAAFEGQFNAAHTEIAGTFTQGGMIPLTLKKIDKVLPAPLAKPRPQDPVRPYPYDEQEVKYENRQQNVTLAGTLTLPRTAGPFAAVLLITGSGPQDRDETLLGHKPFLVLADYLTRRGIAVLRVDDRGVGKSTGNFGTATSADFATDVQAGVAYLKTRKEINHAQIGLAGHSEGGLIGPLVASQNPDVAFVVMLAGPGVPGDQILALQGDLIAKANGGTPQAIARVGELRKRMFAVVRAEPDALARTAKLRAVIKDALAQMTEAEKKQIGDPEAFTSAQVQTLDTPWMRYFLTYDPRPALRKVTCPVLALNGANDLQVPPKQNLPEIAMALSIGGNKDFALGELPDLNHLFQTSKTGSPSEYASIEETFAPSALQIIGDWIVQHTQATPKP